MTPTAVVALNICLSLIWYLAHGEESNRFYLKELDSKDRNVTINIICKEPQPQNGITVCKNDLKIKHCTTLFQEPFVNCTNVSLKDVKTSSTVMNYSMILQIEYAETDFLIEKWVCQNGETNHPRWNLPFPKVTCPPKKLIKGEIIKSIINSKEEVLSKHLEVPRMKRKQSYRDIVEPHLIMHVEQHVINMNVRVFQLPIDATLNIVKDNITIDVTRFFNNTCYNTDGRCINTICACNISNKCFTSRYRIAFDRKCDTFGIEYRFMHESYGEIMKALYFRNYDGTYFSPLHVQLVRMTKFYHVEEEVHSATSTSLYIGIVFSTLGLSVFLLVQLWCYLTYNEKYKILKQIAVEHHMSADDQIKFD